MKNKTLNIWQIKKAEPLAAKQVNSAFEKFFQAAAKPRERITCLACQLDQRELKQMEPILNFQVPAEGLELVSTNSTNL